MPEYISSFISGFEPFIAETLHALLPGVNDIRVSGGLVSYNYSGVYGNIHAAGIFNNTFIVLARFFDIGFSTMIQAIVKKTNVSYKRYIKPGCKFRVRFQQNGRFVHVPESDLAISEGIVTYKTGLAVDRARPDVEFWYIIRADGSGIYAMLTVEYASMGRRLQPGELRPELARLICLFSGMKKGDVVLDPFAGYGSIVEQAAALNGNARVFACDIDQRMVEYTIRRSRHLGARADIQRADARSLGFICDGSIDHIITDPPWAEYDKAIGDVEALYRASFTECARVLKSSGALTLVTSKKAEAESAARATGFMLDKKLDILVNGKKAGVYRFISS